MNRGVAEADSLFKEGMKMVGVTRGLLPTSRDKKQQGCDMVTKAANIYKVNKLYDRAGDAYWECAKIQPRLDSVSDACINYVNAANCYIKTQPELAAKCHQKAADLWVNRGRLVMGGKQFLKAGEVFETELRNVDKAVEMYEKALAMFEAENQPAISSKAKEKLALLQMEAGKFFEAKEKFEALGMYAKDQKLLHFGAYDHFFKASLCALALDYIHGEVAMKLYLSEHPAFENTRQHQLIAELIRAFKEDSVGIFDEAVKSYTLYSTSHNWLFKVLSHIRSSLPCVSGEDEFGLNSSQVDQDVKQNPLISSMIKSGSSLKALYLHHTTSKHSKSSAATNSASFRMSDLDDRQEKSQHSRQNDAAATSSGNFRSAIGGGYNDSLNPFSESYRDASDDELDLT